MGKIPKRYLHHRWS